MNIITMCSLLDRGEVALDAPCSQTILVTKDGKIYLNVAGGTWFRPIIDDECSFRSRARNLVNFPRNERSYYHATYLSGGALGAFVMDPNRLDSHS